jgi:hypothetical protein
MSIITFEGKLKTLSPFTVQLPNKKSEFPLTVDGLPMIQSSTIRGWLRHSVHIAITHLTTEQGVKFNVADHHFMGLGQDVHHKLSKKSQNERKTLNRKLKKDNPFFAVFGCWLSSGRLAVNNAVAENGTQVQTLSISASSNILKSDTNVLSHIDPEQINELDQVLLAKASYKEDTNHFRSEIKALQEKLNTKGINKTFERMVQNSIQNLEAKLSQIELINSKGSDRICNTFSALSGGTILHHGLRLNNPSENDFMFLIWTMFVASKQPMGGKVGHGFGQMEFEYDIYYETLFDVKRKLIGVVGYNHTDGFYINAVDDLDKKQNLISKESFNIHNIHELLIQNAKSYGKFI